MQTKALAALATLSVAGCATVNSAGPATVTADHVFKLTFDERGCIRDVVGEPCLDAAYVNPRLRGQRTCANAKRGETVGFEGDGVHGFDVYFDPFKKGAVKHDRPLTIDPAAPKEKEYRFFVVPVPAVECPETDPVIIITQ